MSSLIEVLKDKESRKPFIRLGVYLSLLVLLVFGVGFFAAFMYNVMFPKQSEYIYKNLFKQEKTLKQPTIPQT